MTAGLTIYNDNNKIQIDGNYKNLYLSRKIAITKTGVISGEFSAGECLAAVGGTTAQTIDAYCVNTPTGYNCTVNKVTSGMSIYIFSTTVQQSTHGVGLQVFNDNGAIVYDSNNKHPLVLGFGQQEANPTRAKKPAVAVADDIKIIYHGRGEHDGFEDRMETELINHPAEYGYYYERELQGVWDNNGHYSLEWVEVRKYGIIKDAWTEVKTQWVRYYYIQPYTWSEWNVSNFGLQNGHIKRMTISAGRSENTMAQKEWSKTWRAHIDHQLTTKGIVVDTRSWLLLDVSDL